MQSYMAAFIVGDGPMQVVELNYNESCEVYNFPDSYDYAHSHIHYNYYKNTSDKDIYRSLSNPDCSSHQFYPLERIAQSAKPVGSINDFPFDYESNQKYWLQTLTKEQLQNLYQYLSSQKETKTLSKTR